MPGSAQPEPRPAAGDNFDGRVLAETELDSALQLLVERAQYITGATGTALALPQGEEMVCRASAGGSAPAIGARLQVRSGLTGESIARRQLLRCDNAETDPRVNLEACRALGIASIVVLPLLRRNGEVRGLFELFSDHPYAFEERDLVALERMAGLTLTALDLAEQRQDSAPAPTARRGPERAVESLPEIPIPVPKTSSASASAALPLELPLEIPGKAVVAEPSVAPAEPDEISPSLETAPVALPASAPIPEALLRVQKCASCGFPVSEGRMLCLDCERKNREKKEDEKTQREWEQSQIAQQQAQRSQTERDHAGGDQAEAQQITATEPEQDAATDSAAASAAQGEFVPAFLANAAPAQESWLANHVNLLAIVVLILGILVAVVVFR
jgi:uncharacterized Zn finger protein (UPF0148 family)